MNYLDIITLEPGKRGGKPCIRGIRITVYDVLEYLATGMTEREILNDFPYLTHEDILACLAYAADRENNLLVVRPCEHGRHYSDDPSHPKLFRIRPLASLQLKVPMLLFTALTFALRISVFS